MGELWDEIRGLVISFVLGVALVQAWNWAPRRIRRRNLRGDVHGAYLDLRAACEPETLNPAAPGNPAYMKAHARDVTNPLVQRLERAGFTPPEGECSVDEGSLQRWFLFLRQVRNEIGLPPTPGDKERFLINP